MSMRLTRILMGLLKLLNMSARRKRRRCLVEFSEKSSFWFCIGEQINEMHNASI